ncbi:MAG TPA: alpha/beta fold hydrolase BchO [Woeseiaceae bacterium]
MRDTHSVGAADRDQENRLPDGLPDADWPNRAASRCVTAAGIQWHVQQCGTGPVVLLLHGTGAATHSWRDLMPALARWYTVVAPDLPGHGFSSNFADRRITLPRLSESVDALLKELQADPAVVVGHSAGAAILIHMALRRSISPQCIIGINAALLPFTGPAGHLFAPLAKLCASAGMVSRMLARRARDSRAVERLLDGTGSRISKQGVDCYQQVLCRESHVAATLGMMANWDLQPIIAGLPSLDTYLHLVVGSADRTVSADQAEQVRQYCPRADITRLPNLGHLAHEEKPQQTAGLIRSIVKSLNRDPSNGQSIAAPERPL